MAPLRETDIPNFPFEKVSMDISGPYGETPRANQYIASFVDWLTNWPEAYALPDKKAQTVSDVILIEIFPRYGSPVQLVTDNGPENVNRIMREALESLRVEHVTTSPYHPQSNAKVERFHKTLADVLSKLVKDNEENWDLYLTQALAAVRFCENETSKFSPYYMIFGRDVVLPVDNLLKPRRKYMGEDHHKLIIEKQHRIFAQARRRIAHAQKRHNARINKGREEVKLGIGNPVYYKVNLRQGKLSAIWEPYYRIVDQTGPVTFVIWDQVSGKVKRAHANELKLARIDTWEGPELKQTRRKRRTVTLADSEEEESGEESDYNLIEDPRVFEVTEQGDKVIKPGDQEVDEQPPMSNTGNRTCGSD